MMTNGKLEESTNEPNISIIILTYNRPGYLKKVLETLVNLPVNEIVIVDNNSQPEYVSTLACKYDNVFHLRLEQNFGAVARNFGLKYATSEVIVCLDDDVWGIQEKHLSFICSEFQNEERLGALCFRVTDEKTGDITNWMHHKLEGSFSSREFYTYEISEGAVAFRKNIFESVGYFNRHFFISHEGPDLALRMINSGLRIKYTPLITVVHAHADEARTSWRRYYFDSRNLIWLAFMNYNWPLIIRWFPIQIAALAVYSIRDGYFKYFLKAIYHGAKELRTGKFIRNPIGDIAYKELKKLEQDKPSFLYMVRKRLFKREIKL